MTGALAEELTYFSPKAGRFDVGTEFWISLLWVATLASINNYNFLLLTHFALLLVILFMYFTFIIVIALDFAFLRFAHGIILEK
jgi:hypothetical protein